MAHFRGTVRGGRTEASRLGHKTTGLSVNAASWEGAVSVYLYVDERTEQDYARVSLAKHQGRGTERVLYDGPVSGEEPTQMLTARINLRKLHAVSLVACTEATRYYLQGVLIEVRADGVLYTATDGHSLLCAYHVDDEPNTLLGSWIIPTEDCRAFKPKVGREGIDDYVTLSAESATSVTLTLGNRIVKTIDGTFPDFRRVLPNGATYLEGLKAEMAKNKPLHAPAHFNFNKLAVFAKACAMLAGARDLVPRICYQAHDLSYGPAAIAFPSSCGEVFGVLMPMRNDDAGWTRPTWIDPPRPIAKAA